MRSARTVAGFAGVSALLMVVPMAVLPVVARAATLDEWAGIAIGQSVGAVAMLVISCGWSLSGPARIVRASSPREAAGLLAESQALQVTALAVAGPLAVALAWVLGPPPARSIAALAAFAGVFAGLSPFWFSVGKGRYGFAMITIAVPQLVMAAVTVPLVLHTEDPAWYIAGTGLANAFSPLAARFAVRQGTPTPKSSLRELARQQRVSTLTVLLSGGYTVGAISLASTVLGTAPLAVLSSGERLFRVSGQSISTLTDGLQRATLSSGSSVTMRRAFFAHVALGVLGLLGLGALGPPITGAFFGESLRASQNVMIAFGFAFLMLSLNSCIGRLLLVPAGRDHLLLRSTTLGILVGAPGILLGGALYGASGAAWGLAIGEAAVTATQLAGLLARRRAPDHQDLGAAPVPPSAPAP